MYCLVGKKEDKVQNNVLNIRVLFTLFFFFFFIFFAWFVPLALWYLSISSVWFGKKNHVESNIYRRDQRMFNSFRVYL